MNVTEMLGHWGIAFIFVTILLDLGGLPLPAAPWLILAGALSVDGPMRSDLLLAAAVGAALIADHVWFFVGRRHGRKLLETVCRVSLSPDICVSRTDELLGRYGPALLLFAKYIPGVSAVSIPTMAAIGVRYRTFLAFDVAGCLIWAGGYIGAGAIFNRQVDRILDGLGWIGGGALAAIAMLIAGYVGLKLLHRRRLVRLHRLVRITPREVREWIDAGNDFVILDARSRIARSSDPRMLPHSVVLDDPRTIESLPPELRARTVVTFCTCPNEASAAFVADLLMRAGYANVRVLTGGEDALAMLHDR
jgi:membrane protein DedA with SNARE-associated domain/rhodanese-related sulfurtransferase